MPTKNSINGIHAQRLKDIRAFVNFNYDARKPFTKYQKSKIKKYHDEINALTARPYQVYKPRKKDRLKQAQQFAQHEKNLPGLKVAFIPTDGVSPVKLRFNKKGEISAVSEYVTTRIIKLDTDALLKDAAKHVASRIKNRVENSYTVLAGRYEIPVGLTKATLPNYVEKLTTKYNKEKGNSYHGNWLHGVAAHQFTNQANFSEYLNEKQINKKKLQRKRRNTKARKRRAK